MSKPAEHHFIDHLQDAKTEQALTRFVIDFIHAHLSDNHLATYRLLIAESAKPPEITQSFPELGADDTQLHLVNNPPSLKVVLPLTPWKGGGCLPS